MEGTEWLPIGIVGIGRLPFVASIRGYINIYATFRIRKWRTSFGEIESIIGFDLPPSARTHRPWWANQKESSGHSQALAWTAAGWETAEIDMGAESLLLRRRRAELDPKPSLNEIWPVHPTAVWPENMNLRREAIYEESI